MTDVISGQIPFIDGDSPWRWADQEGKLKVTA